jgi:hypothetical protein
MNEKKRRKKTLVFLCEISFLTEKMIIMVIWLLGLPRELIVKECIRIGDAIKSSRLHTPTDALRHTPASKTAIFVIKKIW